MEREILFRGKANDTKEWLMGDLISHTYENPNIRPIGTLNGYIVFPETVGQYTGLTDKNGVRIFEGDILEALNGNRGYVVFRNGAFMKSCNSENMPFLIVADVNAVIGNIHDNPEMLKGE